MGKARGGKKKKTGKRSGGKSGKKLVIVESPAKAKTIEKFLGGGYTVKASYGHVRDLPKSSFGIDVENDFQPKYVTLRDKLKVIKSLKAFADKAPEVYLAPDPDREGEAIAWHLAHALKLDSSRFRRVSFNEITKKAVAEAFRNPGEIDTARVDSQQTRRMLDRIVGYRLSPLLWKKLRKQGLSAGRVQSAALRIVCEREAQIEAFEPKEYWRIFALLEHPGGNFVAELKTRDSKKFQPVSEAQAKEAVSASEGKAFLAAAVSKRTIKARPYPPFATSQLQQAASSKIGFSPAKTMRIAQQLYEGVELGPEGAAGLITYMRTDSFRLSNEALGSIRSLVKEEYGEKYLPEKAVIYRSRGRAQEAHEAVRPTDINRTPDRVKTYLNRDQYRLYDLIWRRTVTSQMTPAVYEQTTVNLEVDRYGWRARGRVLLFDGYLKVYNDPHWQAVEADVERGDEPDESPDNGNENGESERLKFDESQMLPPVRENESLPCIRIDPQQKFTQPPSRYTEAGLVKLLEREGIGRPSTYAETISKIQDRKYVIKKKRAFQATVLGRIVNDRLVESFPTLMDLKFTGYMEEQLDEIEENKADWVEVLRKFYEPFMENLSRAEKTMKDAREGEPTAEKCPKCGLPMTLHVGRYGPYLWCTDREPLKAAEDGGREPDDGKQYCGYRVSVDEEGKPIEREEPELTEHSCPKCGTPGMMKRSGRFGPYLECVNEECKNRISLDKEGKPKKKRPAIKTNVPCPKCKAPMVIRISRRGPFLGCSKYPRCRGTRQMIEELREPYTQAVAAGNTDIVLELSEDHPVFSEKADEQGKAGKRPEKNVKNKNR